MIVLEDLTRILPISFFAPINTGSLCLSLPVGFRSEILTTRMHLKSDNYYEITNLRNQASYLIKIKHNDNNNDNIPAQKLK